MIPSPCKTQTHQPDAGFTYIGVLIAVALVGTMLALTATMWHQVQQREKEKQLLFIGNQFRQAIASYYDTPGLVKQFPKKLEDLLEDKRVPYTRRYLRKIFHDPFTGSIEWGLVKNVDNGIEGVYSLSDAEPLKKANFDENFAQLAGKKHYSDWQFIYTAGSVPTVIIGQNASEIPALPPAETIPPEYVPPPTQPIKPNSPDDRKRNFCEVTHGSDLGTCLNMVKKFGQAAGANCLASAASRYTACLSGATMPTLSVQYE